MSVTPFKIPRSGQPRPGDYGFDLDAALACVASLSSTIPANAFTAETLGTERAGNAVLLSGSGLFLTIGYLVAEAQSVWLTLNSGQTVQGDVLAYDQETGFGLVQPLGRVNLPGLRLGSSADAKVGDRVVTAGAGGVQRSVAARIVAKQEFAGYWEYLLDEAIFTTPSHPHWGGTALIGETGELLGIGSLQLQQESDDNLNMIVPIDLLKPILDDLLRTGSSGRPARPWLGFYGTDVEDQVVIAGVADRSPAEAAGLQVGDTILAVAGEKPANLADLYRRVWGIGDAGIEVPLTVSRSGRAFELAVLSVDRSKLLARRILH